MNKILWCAAVLLLLATPACVLLGLQPVPCVDDGDCSGDAPSCNSGVCGAAPSVDPVEGEGEEGEGDEGEGEEGEGEEGEGEGEGEEGEGEGEEGEGEGEGDGEFFDFDVEVDDDFAADDAALGHFTTLGAAVAAVTSEGTPSPVIRVRRGDYSESAPLTLPAGTTIRGATFDEFGNDVFVDFTSDAFAGPSFRLERLRIDTNGNAYVDATHADFDVEVVHCALVDGDFNVNNNFAPAPITRLSITDSDLGDVDVFLTGGGANGVTLARVDADDLNLQLFVEGAIDISDSDLRVTTFREGFSGTSLTVARTTLRETAGAFSCNNIIEAGAVDISESVFTFTHCPPLIVRDNNALGDVDIDVDFSASTGPVIISRELATSTPSLGFRNSTLPGGATCGPGLCFCAESLDDTTVDLGGGTICDAEVATQQCQTGVFPCD